MSSERKQTSNARPSLRKPSWFVRLLRDERGFSSSASTVLLCAGCAIATPKLVELGQSFYKSQVGKVTYRIGKSTPGSLAGGRPSTAADRQGRTLPANNAPLQRVASAEPGKTE